MENVVLPLDMWSVWDAGGQARVEMEKGWDH